jgi:hypothetical protein
MRWRERRSAQSAGVMKRHACMLFAIASFAACTNATNETWLQPPPSSLNAQYGGTLVDETTFFEVPASKLASAEVRLEHEPVVRVDGGAAVFGRSNFICDSPASVYLVRAQYTNGGTGRFNLYLVGTALVVSHFSLGESNRLDRSALVVCLKQKPLEVFGAVGGAA